MRRQLLILPILLFVTPAMASPLVAQFFWPGQGTLNGTVAGDLFILEQPFNSDEATPGRTAGSWRWSSSAGSRPATITVAGSDALTVTDRLSISVDSRSVRLTAASGLGIGYFGSLGGYDLKSTFSPVTLGTDPFGLRSIMTDQGTFVGFDRGTTTFSVAIADSVVGDYSGNGLIDAADYTVWRDTLGADTLPNRSPLISGEVGQEDFDFWKSQFTGAESSFSIELVPEPNVFLLIVSIASSALAIRRRSIDRTGCAAALRQIIAHAAGRINLNVPAPSVERVTMRSHGVGRPSLLQVAAYFMRCCRYSRPDDNAS